MNELCTADSFPFLKRPPPRMHLDNYLIYVSMSIRSSGLSQFSRLIALIQLTFYDSNIH